MRSDSQNMYKDLRLCATSYRGEAAKSVEYSARTPQFSPSVTVQSIFARSFREREILHKENRLAFLGRKLGVKCAIIAGPTRLRGRLRAGTYVFLPHSRSSREACAPARLPACPTTISIFSESTPAHH